MARTGERFSRDLIADTLAGRTLPMDAYRLLVVKKQATFDKITAYHGLRAVWSVQPTSGRA